MFEVDAIGPETQLTANPLFVLREESDACALLFDPDRGRVHLLNPAAVSVWKLLNGRMTLREVTAALANEFDGMGPEALSQVVALARSLADLGAVGTTAGRF